MILSRQVFEYQQRPIIEKVTIQLPFRYQGLFPDEGCFLYITGADSKVWAAESVTILREQEAVLLKCGSYFVDWIKGLNSESVEVIAFHLYADVLRSLYHQGFPNLIKQQMRSPAVRPIVHDEVLTHFIQNLAFYFDNPSLINEDVLELKIRELVLLLTQSTQSVSVIDLLKDLFSPHDISLREVVHQHLYSDLSNADLAHLCGMSLSSFRRHFEETFQDSPTQYILKKRLEKARELMESTSLKIAEVAFQSGFTDPSYFARAFKKQFGQTPTTYRAQIRRDVIS
ncbi:AraC family transcriptional regulator [Pontibacter sp. G13]|uniref:AraC family transcriptional regulator n=1 Tax=Pontibacter sp. G13 TaxID=3074898 RepID=UPI00288B4284|nr:AraC family transcriptional regulator [Pontibacter sp. G13]WNJ17066.1 AraC family transcriptional regulator [Pontibacter sp. G13]